MILQIIRQDIIHYRRSLLATLLLSMVCSTILTGALLVGDSVRYTLKNIARTRLGEKTRWAMTTGDRFFRQGIADELEGKTNNLLIIPVLALNGILESPDGSTRINHLNVYGIHDDFVQLACKPGQAMTLEVPRFSVSESVASRIEMSGDYLLRFQTTSQLSQDMVFSNASSDSQAWSIEVNYCLPDGAMGRFDLQATQSPPLNVFVPIEWLAEKAGISGKANMLLVGIEDKRHSTESELSAALKEIVNPEDLALKFHSIETENVFELRTPRIFIDEPVAAGAMKTGTDAFGVFTHLVNEIRCGEKTVPYSMVSGINSGLNKSLSEQEIIINEWLADELAADVGDVMELTYYKLADTRRLIEETSSFTVSQIVPMMGSYADPTLMPDYPGMTESDSCRNWESGLPIELDKIHSRDEAYWDRYRGAPKAFVSMAAAKKIWANRFGTLTAVRWPASRNTLADIQHELRDTLDLSQIGFVFRDVKAVANKSASGSTDFSGLFAGLSMFLVISAAVLLALGFAFYIESRSNHIGLLLAVGWNRTRISGLFLAEGGVLAIIGCISGAVISVVYTQSMIILINTSFWSKALASLHIGLGVSPFTLLKGIIASFLMSLFAMQVSLYRRLRRPAHRLLTGTSEESYQTHKRKEVMVHLLGWGCLLGGVIVSLQSRKSQMQVASFFSTGLLCLVGVLMILAYCLTWLRHRSGSFARSLKGMAVKNLPRRLSRTLAVLISLSCGVFLVVSVGANYKHIDPDIANRQSGTGGFALMGSTTLPVTQKISLPADTENQDPGIDPEDVLPMRIYQQDDASCLDLHRAQNPTILGVNVKSIAAKNPFSFQSLDLKDSSESPWSVLTDYVIDGIPVVGDYATVYWGLGKNIGDTIKYTDEKGRTATLYIAGVLKESVLQGRLLMSEANFVRLFPSVDGYDTFLIDADIQNSEEQAKQLNIRYRDYGMEIISTADRLSQFNEVENTYLMIFLVLGGLGLILGSLGLGFVLTLNVLDRRGELALMQAVGFRPKVLQNMLFYEHSILLAAGIFCGLIPALWAVWPSILMQGKSFPFLSVVLIIFVMLVIGMVWIQLAGRIVLKKNFLDVLRNQ